MAKDMRTQVLGKMMKTPSKKKAIAPSGGVFRIRNVSPTKAGAKAATTEKK